MTCQDHLVADDMRVTMVDAAGSKLVGLTGADLEISGTNVSFTVPDMPDRELSISVIAASANVLSCEGAERRTDTNEQNGALDFNAPKPRLHH